MVYDGGGDGNPLQYSCLENPLDRGAWQAIVHRVAKSQTRLKQLSTMVCELNINLKIDFLKRLEVRNQVESHFFLLLRLLPLHGEEKAFPEAPWPTHCCNFHSWIT